MSEIWYNFHTKHSVFTAPDVHKWEREREKERQTERVRDRETDRQSMWHACVHVHMHVHAHVSQMLLSCNHMLSQNTTICVHCRNYIVCHKTHTTTTTKKKEKKTSHQQHMFSLSTCTNSHLPFAPKYSSKKQGKN